MKKLFIIITLFLSIFIFINSKCEEEVDLKLPKNITEEYNVGVIEFRYYTIYVLEEKETGIKIYFSNNTDSSLAVIGGK